MNKNIVRALVESLEFLELSDDDTVNPDAAIKVMEIIGFHLPKLSREEQANFASILVEIAAEMPNTEVGHERSEYITRIPEYFEVNSIKDSH